MLQNLLLYKESTGFYNKKKKLSNKIMLNPLSHLLSVLRCSSNFYRYLNVNLRIILHLVITKLMLNFTLTQLSRVFVLEAAYSAHYWLCRCTSICFSLLFRLSFVDGDKPSNNSVKAFMPIRRSERRPKKNQTADIIQKLQNIGTDDSRLPLEISVIPGKNRGVVPTKKLSK